MSDTPGQRIDQWLWRARFFKTRSLAAKCAAAGKMRLDNGRNIQQVPKPSQLVRSNDILTFAQGRRIRVVRVLALPERRGPAAEAATHYDDLSTPQMATEATGTDAAGRRGGRPTKRDRRQIDKFRQGL